MRVSLFACLLLVATSGCASGPNPKLSMPGGTMAPAGLYMSDVPTGGPLSYGSIMLCVTGPGEAVIERISIHQMQGALNVDAFAVRSLIGVNRALGAERHPLDSTGFDPKGAQVVSARCTRDSQSSTFSDFVELGVQVSRTSGDIGDGTGLDITYRAGGAEATYTVPFGIRLCSATCPDG